MPLRCTPFFYFSFLFTILKSASGFIRRELGHRLHLRHVPELIFHATDSIEYSANISRILNSLDIKEDEEENDESV